VKGKMIIIPVMDVLITGGPTDPLVARISAVLTKTMYPERERILLTRLPSLGVVFSG
jgi:hypothetical protein